MEAKRQTCVITLFNEETKAVSFHHVSQASVAEALAKSTSLDVPLEDFDYKVDDDLARRFGGVILGILAGRSPFLKEHLAITFERDPYGADDASTGASAPAAPEHPAKRKWFGKK
jgi:hypothetical protein